MKEINIEEIKNKIAKELGYFDFQEVFEISSLYHINIYVNKLSERLCDLQISQCDERCREFVVYDEKAILSTPNIVKHFLQPKGTKQQSNK